jgi:hypothetical protein
LDLHYCVANYRLTGPWEKALAVLDRKPDFQSDEGTTDRAHPTPLARYVWLCQGESAAYDQSIPSVANLTNKESVGVLGNVLVYHDRLVVEAFSKKRYLFARQMADRFFAGLARFEREAESPGTAAQTFPGWRCSTGTSLQSRSGFSNGLHPGKDAFQP